MTNFISVTARFGRGKNRRIIEMVPGINPNTTWGEWKDNFISNIWYAVEVDQSLRTKWNADSVLDFYRTNLHELASKVTQGEIEQIITPSNTYPYRKNNLEKIVSLADQKGQKVIKNIFQTANSVITGIRNLKSGVLRQTRFCRARSNYKPRSLSFEPFIRKLFDRQTFTGNRAYTSKFFHFHAEDF